MMRDAAPVYLGDLGSEDDSSHRERRRRARMEVRWPLTFCGVDCAVETVTDNLSSEGFYCVANVPLLPGEVRDCTLGVPSHNRGGTAKVLPMLCRIRIVRMKTLHETELYGIGCHIEDFRLAPVTVPGAR